MLLLSLNSYNNNPLFVKKKKKKCWSCISHNTPWKYVIAPIVTSRGFPDRREFFDFTKYGGDRGNDGKRAMAIFRCLRFYSFVVI